MQFRLLGTLEVTAGDTAVEVAGAKPQALLAILLLNAGQAVGTDRLVEHLWGNDPPGGAAVTLRAHVAALRRSLGTGGEGLVVTRRPGYAVHLEGHSLDVSCFHELAAAGRRAAAAGDWAGAAAHAERALGLWRGPALADFVYEPFARAAATQLEEARMVVFEDRVSAMLALGRHAEVVGALEAAAADEPLRENLWGRLMLALYRSGRQAEALRAYQRGRRALADELGIGPGPELIRLEQAILAQAPELDWAPHDRRRAARAETRPREPARVPLPPLLVGTGQLPFVGRAAELERLRLIWKEVAEGSRRLALLSGEPGVGKSRLAGVLAASVGADALVLAGRCDEDLGVPYQPFVEALRHFVDHAPDLGARLGRYGGELERLVPGIARRAPGLAPLLESDPETERYRLFEAVAAWLAAVGSAGPVLLVIEDLQWAAKPTLLLLRHLVRSAEPLRLLVVATYRDGEVGRGGPLAGLLADLRRDTGVERLALNGLAEPEVMELVEAAAGQVLDDDDRLLVRAIHAETQGNPFFLGEVLRHLAESGVLSRRGGRWVRGVELEEVGIPDGVREVVGRRLSRLSGTADVVLGVAAVVGAEFDLAVLREVTGLPGPALLAALDEAMAARLVAGAPGHPDRHRFAHELVRATLYSELSTPRRAALHRRVAEAIESLAAGGLEEQLPALAHHWSCASAFASTEAAKAIHYATRAGDRALVLLAHDEAAVYYRRALELLDAAEAPAGDDRRLRVLVALGEAQQRAGDPAHRRTLLDAARLARRHGDPDLLARAALANHRGIIWSTSGFVDTERVAAIEAALEASPGTESPSRARLLASLALELTWGDRERRHHLSDEALALARRLGDPATLAHVLSCRYVTISEPATMQERVANTDELARLAETIPDPVVRCRSLYLQARAAMEMGEIARADRAFEQLVPLAARLGQPTLQWFATWSFSGRRLLSGDYDDAERLALEALEIGRTAGQQDAPLFFAVHRFQVCLEQGRLAEQEPHLREHVERNPGIPTLAAMLALTLSELDRLDDTRRLFRPLAAGRFGAFPLDITWLRSMTSLATVASHLGDREAAGVLADLLGPWAHQLAMSGGVVLGSVSHHLGLLATVLGRFDEAERRFEAATAAHARIGAPALLARTRLDWARLELARRSPGDLGRARDRLAAVLATTSRLGLATMDRKARELLESAGPN